MHSLKILLLGSPKIWLNDELLTFESRKGVALLAYLAITEETHSRAALAALFWPESDQQRARGALRYTLSILRREIGDGWLWRDRKQISWQPSAEFALDVADFCSLIAEWEGRNLAEMDQAELDLCEQRLETAVSLYRDDFLAGFSLRDAPDFNEWVYFQSENLRQKLSQGLQMLIKLHGQQENWETAVSHARRWLQLDQLHEPAHQTLMQAYANNGQWRAALHQYESCVTLLEQELSVEPSLITTAIYAQIRQGRPTNVSTTWTTAQTIPQTNAASQILLEKVNRFWIEGVLEQASPPNGLLPLTITPYQQAIEHPWQAVLGTAVTDQRTPFSPSCLDYYKASDYALLILGAAGAGKTLTLIQLAHDLIQRWKQQNPIPVILNLSTWAEKQNLLFDWIVEDLTAKYQIPHKIGRLWLEAGQLTLLLDGLDELPGNRRDACILAVNSFRQKHGLNGIVICCRHLAYLQIGTKLNLNSAILIQPLDGDQIETYLEQNAAPPALFKLLAQNEALNELAQSPLTLNILVAAYDTELERTLAPAGQATTRETKQSSSSSQTEIVSRQIFAAYVRHMFQRRRPSHSYSREQTVPMLSWLAHQMQNHNQTIFLIESIQPSWLPSDRWRWFYMLFSRSVGGFIFGIIDWLFIIIGQTNIPGLQVNMVDWASKTFHLPTFGNNILPVLLLSTCLGSIMGLLDGFLFMRHGETPVISRKTGWRHLTIIGTSAFLIATLFMALFDPLLLALFVGLLQAISFILAFGYLDRGQSFRTEVRTVEALGWSWQGSTYGLLPGLIFGSISSYLLQTLYTPQLGVEFFYGSLVIFVMFSGLQHGRLETTDRPNQGIWLSGRNGGIAAVAIATAMTFTFWLIGGNWPTWHNGVLFGLIAGLIYGGSDVLRHFTLRAILWITGHTPLRYVHFLDFAVSRVLLRRVGGGYIFRHRLLQEYFAEVRD